MVLYCVFILANIIRYNVHSAHIKPWKKAARIKENPHIASKFRFLPPFVFFRFYFYFFISFCRFGKGLIVSSASMICSLGVRNFNPPNKFSPNKKRIATHNFPLISTFTYIIAVCESNRIGKVLLLCTRNHSVSIARILYCIHTVCTHTCVAP